MGLDILNGLNKEQIEAVTTTEGYVRVIAGAGSGKTKALTTRYAYLVDHLDISPNRILSVTFTNKAANEMKERIMGMVGEIGTPYIMTFHGFCNRFLRSEIEVLGISSNFKIMDTDDQLDILKVVYAELGISNKDIPYKKALTEIIGSGCKNGQRSYLSKYEELMENSSSYELHKLMELAHTVELKIIYGYLREQKRDACLDYEDLLNYTLYILKTRKEVRESWENAFDYIQVDEFQDVSLREVELVGILAMGHKNLFVVGDDSQCITSDSCVLTDKGYKNACEISESDKLVCGVGQGEIGLFNIDDIIKKEYKGIIYKVSLCNGNFFKATGDHKVFAVRNIEIPVSGNNFVYYFKGPSKKKDIYTHVLDTPYNTQEIDDYDKVLYNLGMKQRKIEGSNTYDTYIYGYLSDSPGLLSCIADLEQGDLLPVYKEGKIELEEIKSIEIEEYSGYLYDFNIKSVRNYIVNSCVVHNCIYSFRGSDVNCIVHFEEIMDKVQNTHTDVKSIYMTKNYRSTPEILSVSNGLIKHNINRLDKDLVAIKDDGPRVLHYHARSIYTEADWVARRIANMNRPFSDFAILYRSNSSSRAIEEKLIEQGISYEVLSGISFYSRKEVKDVLAVLSLIAFGDNLSFMRLVKNLSLGIGPKKIAVLKELAGTKFTLYYALQNNLELKTFKSTKAAWLVDLIERLSGYVESDSIASLMGRVFTELNLEETYIKSNEQERWENLQELKRSAQHFEHSQGEKVDLGEYLSLLSLYTNSDKEEKPDSVKLMTIHAAKGLEFPVVFVIGMNEGIMPSSRTVTRDMMEEERRIAYVALTRAKELLFLSDAEGENYDKSYRLPSRFLLNIPRDTFDTEGNMDKYLIAQTEAKMEEDEKKMVKPTSSILESINDMYTIKVGTKVRHSVFGVGEVMQVLDSAYAILFETVGLKGIKKDSTKIEKIG